MGKLVFIKNKYIFGGNKPNNYHYYLKYYDKKHKETRIVGLTHLYEISKGHKLNISNGYLKEEKFKQLYLPSGVRISILIKI